MSDVPDHLGEHLRLVDLLPKPPDRPWLSDLYLDSCTIFGPAILSLLEGGVDLTNCTFHGKSGLDAVIWEVPAEREWVTGVVGVGGGLVFNNCRFVGVGFAMRPDYVATFRAGFSG